MSMEGKVALVTGASRGIGQAIALELGRRQITVVGTATTAAGADSISAEFDNNDVNGEGVMLDVSQGHSIDTVVQTICEKHGAVVVLVNNAGITKDNLLMRMKEREWDQVINIDLSSVYRLSKACLRGMMKAKFGRIINITSVVGLTGNPGQSNYAAAKAGIIGFTKSLAREIGSRAITVNAVAPGFIDTDMTRALTEDQRQVLIQQIPLNRLGYTEEVAKAVAFLASEDANYITGETLNVNGGMHMF